MADTYDVVTLAEAKSALSISHDANNTNLAICITATSNMLDDQCGPIVTRTVTAERHRGYATAIEVRKWPIATVVAFTNYSGGTGTAWTEIGPTGTGQGYTLNPREEGTGTYTGTIESADGTAFGAWVEVSYTAGRAVSTTNGMPSRFKQAAATILENLWRTQEISIGNAGAFEVPFPTFPATFAIPNSVRDLLGDDWRGERNRAMSGVMFG